MKTTKPLKDHSGVTLLELLLVVLIVGILAMIFLPALNRAKARSRQVDCMSQLRQIGIAHHSFAHEHHSLFPFQVSVREGGTLEIVQTAAWPVPLDQWALPHFRALSNDLVDPKVLACPSDNRARAESFARLHSENLSYFICVNSDYNRPEDVLCGDRNIRANTHIPVIKISPDAFLLWSGEMHEYEGNVLFAGGHVQRVGSVGLQRVFATTPNGVALLLPGDPASPSNTGPNSSTAGNATGPGSGNAAATFEGFFQTMSGSPRPNLSASSAGPSGSTPAPLSTASSPSSRTDPTALTGGRSTPLANPVPLAGQPETNRMQVAVATSSRLPSPSPPPATTGSSEEVRNTRSGVSEPFNLRERSFWWFVLIGIAVATLVAILVYQHDRRKMIRSTRLRRMPSYGLLAERRRRGRW
jgi:prepilin-type N-terminal cleavage/methylation domain-containing protein/prepilin-type processing-associated H-X9-DG protein